MGRNKVVSLAQIETRLKDIRFNEEKIVRWIEKATDNHSELIVFPEMSLTGYSVVRDELNERLGDEIEASLSRIVDTTSRLDIDVVISYPEIRGGKSFISAAYISNGKITGTHRKVYLADYFHAVEHHHFNPGNEIIPFDTRFGRVCMLICEDAWHLTTSVIAGQKQTDIIIATSATSITTSRKLDEIQHRWETISTAVGLTQTCYFVYCNRAGTEGNLIFWGGSHIVSPYGKIVDRFPRLRETVGHYPIDLDYIKECKETFPLITREKNDFNLKEFGDISKRKSFDSDDQEKKP
jgi:predicted amidohydrolase